MVMSIFSFLKIIEKSIMSKLFSSSFQSGSERQLKEFSEEEPNLFLVVRSSISNQSKVFKVKVVLSALRSWISAWGEERPPYNLKPLPRMTYEEVNDADDMVDCTISILSILSIFKSDELTTSQRQKLRRALRQTIEEIGL
jgi:hypothetical protein